MDVPIQRREVLRGVASVAAVAAASSACGKLANIAEPGRQEDIVAPEKDPSYYPPERSGLRGSHSGSYETAHAQAWQGKKWDAPLDLGERYDLIVVGGGASGLAAAYHYQKSTGGRSRILILDNHDDFGGHAKRVELSFEGKARLAPGGSAFMETPRFSPEALGLLRDVGIENGRLQLGQAEDLTYRAFNLRSMIHFDQKTYGRDVTLVDNLLPMNGTDARGGFLLTHHVPGMPLSAEDRRQLHDFLTRSDDVWPQASTAEKKRLLRTTSYYAFLTKAVGMSGSAADLFTRHPTAFVGATADATPADVALMLLRMPGLHRLGDLGLQMERTLSTEAPEEAGAHYGPEGNAIITRMLVKRLIPGVAVGESMEELVTARFNYARLDEQASNVRVRLNSTAINVSHRRGGSAVDVIYVRGDRTFRVTGKHCILAGWHMYMPYICPELPPEQKAAMSQNVKVPLLAAQVLLRTARPLADLGAASAYCPGYQLQAVLGWGRNLGAYKGGFQPDEPVMVYLIGAFLEPHSGLSLKDQYRAARRRLFATGFEDFELSIREQFRGLLRGTDFDVRKDLVGLTVDRWGHGYTYGYNSLFDPDYAEGSFPHQIARRRHGRIAIANSDAAAVALVNAAIDQGIRAASELLA
jgi:spermidine dehydrogenase